MTPRDEVNRLMAELNCGLLSISDNASHLSRESGVGSLAIRRVLDTSNKNGCSLYVLVKLCRFLKWKIRFEQPPSPASRGVSPHENDSNLVSN